MSGTLASRPARHDGMARRVEQAVVNGWFSHLPPLVASMATGPTVGVTRVFVLQWTKFSRLFPRWVGSIISNCPEPGVVAYEVENLMSEVVRDPAGDDNHYELLIRLGEAVGLSRPVIEAFESLPEASELFAWLWGKARDPDWLVGFTAVNGLEILGDKNLPARYGVAAGTGLAPEPYSRELGLGPDAVEFFEVSDQADAGHGHETVEIIARYTEEGREQEVISVLEDSMQRLRRMMDAMWKLAQDIDAGPETASWGG